MRFKPGTVIFSNLYILKIIFLGKIHHYREGRSCPGDHIPFLSFYIYFEYIYSEFVIHQFVNRCISNSWTLKKVLVHPIPSLDNIYISWVQQLVFSHFCNIAKKFLQLRKTEMGVTSVHQQSIESSYQAFLPPAWDKSTHLLSFFKQNHLHNFILLPQRKKNIF